MGAIMNVTAEAKNEELITIRTATASDAKEVTDFNRMIIREAPYLLTTEGELSVTYEDQAKYLDRLYHNTGKLALIAEHKNVMIGFLDFHSGTRKRNEHDGTFGMSVHKDWRNQGVGDFLIRGLKGWAEKHPHLEKLSLEVFSQNIGAIHLYIKHGFTQEGRKNKAIKLADGSYNDLIMMGYLLKAKRAE